jgi:hypothetical protein
VAILPLLSLVNRNEAKIWLKRVLRGGGGQSGMPLGRGAACFTGSGKEECGRLGKGPGRGARSSSCMVW